MLQAAPFIASLIAIVVSITGIRQQSHLSRQSNSMPLLIDMFSEHRSEELSDARKFVVSTLPNRDLSEDFSNLPKEEQAIAPQIVILLR